MVIELATGDLMKQYNEEGGRVFSFPLGLKIVTGAAKGIAHMHTMLHPVVHRDVKSKNIMVMRDGETVGVVHRLLLSQIDDSYSTHFLFELHRARLETVERAGEL